MTDRVQLQIEGQIAIVSLNRPDKYNGMDMDMLQAWLDTAKQLKRNRDIRGVILKGNGPAFCAGLDFATVTKSKSDMARVAKNFLKLGRTNNFQQCCWAWSELQVPVVAVTHGYCYGAGLQLAAACDFRFSTADCQFSIMEAKWGLVPDMSGSATLRDLLRLDIAKELTMTGRVFDAEQALQYGLLTRVCADPEAEARALLAEILERSPDSVAGTKALFNKAWHGTMDAGFALERRIQSRLLRGRNQRKAVKANLAKDDAKKKPNYSTRQFDF